MSADQFIGVRVSTETKARLRALAQRQELSESAAVKRILEVTLHGGDVPLLPSPANADREVRDSRLYIRVRAEDRLLLVERAAARRMAPATYVAVLVRSHLRALAPLPKDELTALKHSVAELGKIGRNLNQIAHAAHQGGRIVGPGREDLRAMLRVCEGMRNHVKGLLKANLASWNLGRAESNG